MIGHNGTGQLGVEEEDVKLPKTLNLNVFVKLVAAGDKHTHFLTKDGALYSMGCNEHGQLGLGFSNDVLERVDRPVLVRDVSFKSVDCGKFHSVALDHQGKVWSWGYADEGAIGTRITVSNEPSLLQFSQSQKDLVFRQISCGDHHTCMLSTEGDVFSCGLNIKGQLGIGLITQREYRPIIIRLRGCHEKIKQVSCGC